MPAARPWLVIPVIAALSGAAIGAAARSVELALAAALLGAALAAAVRAFVGAGGIAAISAATGAALGVLGWFELATPSARAAIAGAAAMFAICELVRRSAETSPWPAVGAGALAAVLDPTYAALPVVAVMVVVASLPRRLRRWSIGLAIGCGAIAAVVAVVHVGGSAPRHIGATLRAIGDGMGPLTAVAALAGIVQCASRGRLAAAATLGIVALIALIAVMTGREIPPVPIVGGLAAAVALGRLASLVRLPVGQAFVGVAVGFVLVVVPAWPLVASLPL
ncbi:MAG TPA: hypothetical protein VH143_22805 [Kofleriaceae bacterium]|jgi:hypothetical protein|nr:hypothetical protein [Kofleriaceae bacterium]